MLLNFGISKQCDPISKVDIQGKWYIDEVIYLNTNDTMNITFIKCPYFEFNSNGKFTIESGMNIGSDNRTWILSDSSSILIFSDNMHTDTSVVKIYNYERNTMILEFENIRFNLSRNCIDR